MCIRDRDVRTIGIPKTLASVAEPATTSSKGALFGFGTSDAFRCERHETVDSWLLRLVKSGWEPYGDLGTIDMTLPTYCSASVDDGLVRLGYRGLPLLAVFAYRSGSSSNGAS